MLLNASINSNDGSVGECNAGGLSDVNTGAGRYRAWFCNDFKPIDQPVKSLVEGEILMICSQHDECIFQVNRGLIEICEPHVGESTRIVDFFYTDDLFKLTGIKCKAYLVKCISDASITIIDPLTLHDVVRNDAKFANQVLDLIRAQKARHSGCLSVYENKREQKKLSGFILQSTYGAGSTENVRTLIPYQARHLAKQLKTTVNKLNRTIDILVDSKIVKRTSKNVLCIENYSALKTIVDDCTEPPPSGITV